MDSWAALGAAFKGPDTGWMAGAPCEGSKKRIGRDVFFEEKFAHDRAIAQTMCRDCERRRRCLDFAFESNSRFGIWGGSTRHQRKAIIDGKITVEQHFAWLDGRWVDTRDNAGGGLYVRPFKARSSG